MVTCGLLYYGIVRVDLWACGCSLLFACFCVGSIYRNSGRYYELEVSILLLCLISDIELCAYGLIMFSMIWVRQCLSGGVDLTLAGGFVWAYTYGFCFTCALALVCFEFFLRWLSFDLFCW